MHPILRSSLFDLTTPAFSLLRALEEPLVRAPSAQEEVREDEKSYTLRFEVPGLRQDQLELEVTPSHLMLRGQREVKVPEGYQALRQERSAYRLERRLRFGQQVDPDQAQAVLKDGVLTITLPKAEAARARRISVSAS